MSNLVKQRGSRSLLSSMDFDLNSVGVTEATMEAEAKAAAPKQRESTLSDVYFSPQIGKQIIQLIPFPVPLSSGGVEWDIQSTYFAHIAKDIENGWRKLAFFHDVDGADDVLSEMREELPGWHVMCPQETHGKPCPICKAKWDIGEWYKENTAEGWKHDDLKASGFYTTFRSMFF